MATEQKNALCQLWGLTTSVIDTKLVTLQSIIPDVDDLILLDYLTKCDLNIEQCINYHFSQNIASSPTPEHPLSSNPQNTSNEIQSIHPDPSISNQTSNISSNNTNNSNNNKRKRRRPIRRRKITKTTISNQEERKTTSYGSVALKLSDDDDDDNDNDDESEYDPEEDIKSNRRNHRNHNKKDENTKKRQRGNEMEDDDISSQPLYKRRRISNGIRDHFISENSNNSLSSKQERDSDDDDDDDKEEEIKNNKAEKLKDIIPMIPAINTWNILHFGSFTLRYKLNECYPITNLHDLQYLYKHNKAEFILSAHEWFNDNNDALNGLYHDALSEMQNDSELNGNQMIEIDKTTKQISVDSQNENYRLPFGAGERFSFSSKGLYETSFNISIKKPLIMTNKAINNLRFDIGSIITICRNNMDLYNDWKDTEGLLNEYRNKRIELSLSGLLDFSCKYEYNLSVLQKTQQNKYRLNVNLHEYQLQAIEYMIKEENHPIGFYRHLYKLGRFNDNNNSSFFYYSSAFKQLYINQNLPTVHGGFLTEEMGLGKTIESLALINYNIRNDGGCSTSSSLIIGKTEKKQRWIGLGIGGMGGCFVEEEIKYYKSRATLIIAPVSLIGQWEKECVERSEKKIICKRYYASYRKRDIKLYIDKDIVFTTYGIIAKENGADRNNHILHCIEWHRIILDECHYIKNQNTVTSRNIHNLRGNNKWLLTGTPFGRQIYDIYNQLKFLGLKTEHIDMLKLPKLKSLITKSRPIDNSCIPLLKTIKHLMMRHKKEQKFNNKEIVKMTEKTEDVIYIEFNKQEKEYYDKLYNTAKERYEIYKATGNIGRGSIAILAALHGARQACSGHIYSKQEIEEELSRAQVKTYHVREMVNDERNHNKSAQELYEMALFEAYNMDDAECPICYETPFDDPLQTICRHIFCGECIKSMLSEKPECPMCRRKCTIKQLKKPPSKENIDKKMDKMDIDDIKEKEKEDEKEKEKEDDKLIKFDTKLNVLIGEINKLKNNKPNDKSLIFTSFSKSLDWICKELEKSNIQYRTLTGSMSMNKRKKALEEFSNDLNVKVFVLTVRSGAVGITLTAANHVFIMEPPFNHALYRQAINRVYRLGQNKKVFIHQLIMKHSVEEKIWNINKEKQNQKNNKLEMAGNINMDKSSKLKQHEISKLFQ